MATDTNDKKGSKSAYQRQLKGSNDKRPRENSTSTRGQNLFRERTQQRLDGDEIDLKFGFERIKDGPSRLGWLLNYLPVTCTDDQGREKSGVDLYFIDRTGINFKASLFHKPYFFIDISDTRRMMEISQQLQKRFETCLIEIIDMEDLDMPNHLSGKKHQFLKLSFDTVSELMETKNKLWPIIQQNKDRESKKDYIDDDEEDNHTNHNNAYYHHHSTSTHSSNSTNKYKEIQHKDNQDPLNFIHDMREYDVSYLMRVAIDLDIRVGAWYDVIPLTGSELCEIKWQKDLLERCDLKILAFDIECEKAPLKFPDSSRDRIYMISYMISGQGYLLINRELVSEDVDDFEYTPNSKMPGPFHVINLSDEKVMLEYFIKHIQELKPHVIVTYNGDFFDWPFVETRCRNIAHINLYQEWGIRSSISGSSSSGSNTNTVANSSRNMDVEYTGRCMVHLDAFRWVQRDSYLPQGTQGLKAVTRAKLGYEPVEIDPEDMLQKARDEPILMASYSVSDAVATYYLYTTYVHNFIFSLSTIIPLVSEDVLRKGSGTLCEALLMVEAYHNHIICPNKQTDPLESFHNGHLLESETYIGGHVECLEAGVFRADISTKFKLIPSTLQDLINRIDRDLTFALETEHDIQRSDVSNYDEVRQAIVEKLEMLRDSPLRDENPVIYHLDVGAMYPNIILTNRLQPAAMVSSKDCAACDYNRYENQCKRPMTWTWRGEYSPADQSEYQSIKRQLTYEKVGDQRFTDLSEKSQVTLIKDRLKKYSNRVYKKTKQTQIEDRVNTVCMRENSFYVDTVRAFRDRRYEYKILTKVWKNKKNDAEKNGDVLTRKLAEDKEILMDSLQLAHKCILNSFYGYVMRKGARWRSMEMAGIVTYTGAELIKQARELVEQVGRPLELDTDGIWCILPASFPTDFKFKTHEGKSISIGYPCAMLNADVHDRYTNYQYQNMIINPNTGMKKYHTHAECSIYFELDGPYRAMVLPASPEEGKLLKKKYVVFNFDGTIAELKGFEIKRRGELELVKRFQEQVFELFLDGYTLQQCYDSVGKIANYWLDILDSHGHLLEDESELLELISERKTISKTLEDYDGRKATSLTTASRLADFLGAEMVKDKGLNCNLIISKYPYGAPVTERAIPVAIFSAEEHIRTYYLRKWLKDPTFDTSDFRDVVDWEYYKDRLGKSIQKIITIPAGMQGISNPVPRVIHPIWLHRSLNEVSTGLKQMKISSMFMSAASNTNNDKTKMKNTTTNTTTNTASTTSTIVEPKLITNTSTSESIVTYTNTTATATATATTTTETMDTSSPTSARKRTLLSTTDSTMTVDMEDMIGGSSTKTGGRPVIHMKAKRSVRFDLDPLSPMKHPVDNDTMVTIKDSLTDGTSSSDINMNNMSTDISAEALSTGATSDHIMSTTATTTTTSATITSTDITTTTNINMDINLVTVTNEQDLEVWLQQRKQSWKLKRQEKRSEKQRWLSYQNKLTHSSVTSSFSSSSNSNSNSMNPYIDNILMKKAVGVSDFMKNAYLAAIYGTWQIMELQETDAPGELIVWAMIGTNQLQRLKIIIPRILYVNCRTTEAETMALSLGGSKVKRDLPHNHLNYALYEIQLSEYKYQKNENVLSVFLCDPNVEGVYESQTPLTYRTILKIGCLAQLQGNKDNKTNTFKLKDVNMVHTAVHPYLQTSTSMDHIPSMKTLTINKLHMSSSKPHNYSNNICQYKTIYLFYARDKSRNNGLGAIGLFIIDDYYEEYDFNTYGNLFSGKAYIWLANGRNSIDSKPPFQRLYRKFQPDSTANMKFSTTFVSSLSDAYDACNEALSTYIRQRHGPTLVIAQGSLDSSSITWRKSISSLQEFPLALIPHNSSDDMFPAVGWQLFISERMIQRYLLFPRWLNDRLLCARYSNIPFCNLGQDAPTTMTDVLYGRQLHHNRHLLWSSEDMLPDIGGGVEDDYSLWSDALVEPVVNTPGAYRTTCVELDIFGIDIGAILCSTLLDVDQFTTTNINMDKNNDLFGGKASQNGDIISQMATTDASSCVRAFNLLKAIVAKWYNDMIVRGDVISHSLLTTLYRYLCGYNNPLLQDSSLHRFIYNLMIKLFKRLVGQLRRLGAEVIYANFSRIIINTKKYDLVAAEEYIQFLISTLCTHEIFSYLEIRPKEYWEQVLWLGPENWSGLLFPPPTTTTATATDNELVQEDTDHIYDIENTSDSMKVNKNGTKEIQIIDDDDDDDDSNDDSNDGQVVHTTNLSEDPSDTVLNNHTKLSHTYDQDSSTTTAAAADDNSNINSIHTNMIDMSKEHDENTDNTNNNMNTNDDENVTTTKSSTTPKFYDLFKNQLTDTSTTAGIQQKDKNSVNILHTLKVSSNSKNKSKSKLRLDMEGEVKTTSQEYDFLDDLLDADKMSSTTTTANVIKDKSKTKSQDKTSDNNVSIAKIKSTYKTASLSSIDRKYNDDDFIEDDYDNEYDDDEYDEYDESEERNEYEYEYENEGDAYDDERVYDEINEYDHNKKSKTNSRHSSSNKMTKLSNSNKNNNHKKRYTDTTSADMRGVHTENTRIENEKEGGEEDDDETDNNPLLKSSWNLASYLPSAAAIYFKHIIGEYILQYQKYRIQYNTQRDQALEVYNSQSSSSYNELDVSISLRPIDNDETIEKKVINDMKTLIQKQLSVGLLRLVDELAMVYSHHHNSTNQDVGVMNGLINPFPYQPGAYLSVTSPALEFVKATTHVLALDISLEEEISTLRRLLLSQLRIREFDSQSQFRDPCLSFILNDIICTYCTYCRDYDLLRDPQLCNTKLTRNDRWKCPHCSTNINITDIENRLMTEVDKLCTAYLLQDFRCPRTHSVSTRLCSSSSDLCVPLVMDVSPDQIKHKLSVLYRVAQLHEFEWLLQSITQLLSTTTSSSSSSSNNR